MEFYSSQLQDLFVFALTKGEKGFFLDIGCGTPVRGNNSYSLENEGWSGILIDSEKDNISLCEAQRKNKSFCRDATKIDWRSFLAENNCPEVIDYISLDVDEANYDVMENFPFDSYPFKVMTVEHDLFRRGDRIKNKIAEVLSNHPKYFCLVDNLKFDRLGTHEWCIDGESSFEDWYINKDFFPKELTKLQSSDICHIDFMSKILYLYPGAQWFWEKNDGVSWWSTTPGV